MSMFLWVIMFFLILFNVGVFIDSSDSSVRYYTILVDIAFILIIVIIKLIPFIFEKIKDSYDNRKREKMHQHWEKEALLEKEERQRREALAEEEHRRYLASLSPEELVEYRRQAVEEKKREAEEARKRQEKWEAGRSEREARREKERQEKEARKKQEEAEAKAKKEAQQKRQSEYEKNYKNRQAEEDARRKSRQDISTRTSGTVCCVTCEYWDGVREVGNLSRNLVNFSSSNNQGRCRRPGTPTSGEARSATQNCGKTYKKWVMLK